MTDSQPRILILYPYSSLDTNPTMTFLIESLAARKVRIDVLAGRSDSFATPESFLTPESFGETVRLELLSSDFFFRWWSPLERPAATPRQPVPSLRRAVQVSAAFRPRFFQIFSGFALFRYHRRRPSRYRFS